MEKLSSILPSNARIKSVDLKEAKPRRPGAPSLGVPMGTTSVKDRVSFSKLPEAAAEDLLVYKNPKEMRHAKIAEDTTRKFFETRLQEPKVTETTNEVLNQNENEISKELNNETAYYLSLEDAPNVESGEKLTQPFQ